MEGGDQSTNESKHEAANEVEQFIVFTIDGEEYAIPITDIREVVEVALITPVPDSLPFVLGIMNLRGKIVPILDLEKRLNLTREQEAASRHILITDYENNLMGVQVDQVQEVLRVAKKHIQPAPSMISAKIAPEFISGVVVIPKSNAMPDEATEAEAEEQTAPQQDARVVLLLELKKIITLEELQSLTESSGQVAPAEHTGEGGAA